jgi:hypothetical protein
MCGASNYVYHYVCVCMYTMQDSLGGSARTVVIATLNSAAACQEESTTTLAFAQRCARVTAKLQSCEVSGNCCSTRNNSLNTCTM